MLGEDKKVNPQMPAVKVGTVTVYRHLALSTLTTEQNAETSIPLYFMNQVTKSIRWMPWRQKPKKGVVHCDKPRRAVCRL